MRKKFLVLTLIGLFTLAMAGIAFAAPGDYGSPEDYTGGQAPSQALNGGAGIEAPDKTGNGLVNANRTGQALPGDDVPGIRKASPDQFIHGDFMKNTNACASCHQTHTAAGKNLLFRNGTYSTCLACHDGTMGKLSVFKDYSNEENYVEDGRIKNVGGGTFFYGDGSGNPSMHIPSGILKVSAAPGGNRTATSGVWNADFSCASCHAPHGSYSDRLLHPNPAGRQDEFKAVYDLVPVSAGSNVLKVANDKKGPWLSTSRILNGTTNVTNQFLVNWADGVFEWNGQGTIPAGLKLEGIPALVVYADEAYVNGVKVESGNNVRLAGIRGEEATITRWSGRTAGDGMGGISSFCAACHTDYYLDGAEKVTKDGHQGGKYDTSAYRHNINKGLANLPKGVGDNTTGTSYNMTCLTCHFAHGTNQQIMLEADDTIARFADANPSSALKRYTNMSVCIKCHVSSKNGSFINSDGYWKNEDINKILESNRGPGKGIPQLP